MDFGRIERGGHISLGIPSTNPGTGAKGSLGIAPGVLVKDAKKAYGNRPPILLDYNMTVPRGTIYGLLGSSGCGKTTILSCIVGLRKLDEGKILVCGAKPGTRESGIPGPRVGYMPQDISLYSYMTIKEILQYYGRIYGMTQENIEQRLGYLSGLLELPEASRIIATLSGGQQRRTSLAVALVHQPELLILDEPTVGVDPMLRESIWEHLSNLVRTKKTTVIVTTHYIEETRTAHTVGLMRNGRLLTEKAPNALLIEYQADLLEDIVLKLCRKDELNLPSTVGDPTNEVSQALQEISFYTGNKNLTVRGGHKPDPSITGDRSPIVGLKFKRRFTEENMTGNNRGRSLKRQQSVAEFVQEAAQDYFYSRGDRIRALIHRNYITLFRNYMFAVMVMCIPAIQIIVINLIIGNEPKHMSVGLVNHEIGQVNETGGMACPYSAGCLASGAGCKYVSSLPEEQVIMSNFDSEEDGLFAIKSGKIWGYLSIPENFTEYLRLRGLHRNFADEETITGSTISIKMDMSNFLAGSLLVRIFYENYQKFIQNIAMDCQQSAAVAELPLHYRPIYGDLETGFKEFIGPAALIVILYFVPLASGGIAYIQDKKQGTLDRSMVAGVTAFDVIAAFMVTEGSLVVFQVVLSFIIMVFGFGLTIQGSSILFFFLLLLNGISGLSLGFLIAMLVNEEMEAVIITLGLYTPILILSGIIWPLEGTAFGVKVLSHCLPSTYPTEAIRSIVNRGWGISSSHVWPGFAMLFGWCVLSWILTAIAHRRQNK
ncbi:ABC transporter G family member 23 [Folsomia candida]|uniref:ABC transporter G family member 23 n=1 Tax=Folsomia candida TaxID=158441 RepID=UPI000B8F8819|nr:ABC transporter G family member 23 [Folsomia candida]